MANNVSKSVAEITIWRLATPEKRLYRRLKMAVWPDRAPFLEPHRCSSGKFWSRCCKGWARIFSGRLFEEGGGMRPTYERAHWTRINNSFSKHDKGTPILFLSLFLVPLFDAFHHFLGTEEFNSFSKNTTNTFMRLEFLFLPSSSYLRSERIIKHGNKERD